MQDVAHSRDPDGVAEEKVCARKPGPPPPHPHSRVGEARPHSCGTVIPSTPLDSHSRHVGRSAPKLVLVVAAHGCGVVIDDVAHLAGEDEEA